MENDVDIYLGAFFFQMKRASSHTFWTGMVEQYGTYWRPLYAASFRLLRIWYSQASSGILLCACACRRGLLSHINM